MRRFWGFVKSYWLLCVAIVASVVALALQLAGWKTAADWVLGVMAIGEALPLLWNMWQDIRGGIYGIDILAVTSIVASVLLHQYWAAAVVVLMLTGGEGLENFAEHRAKSELDALLKNAPRVATVIRKGKTLEVSVSEIQVGDRIIIKAGELVPVDSVVVEGAASFDESSLTGESLPEPKDISDRLLSGSLNLDGPVTAKATATAEDSQYQQIIKLVRGAAARQAPFVRLADRYSLPFTVIAYAIASSVWILSGHAIRFLEVIIVATPCPLLLAAPVALSSGMARASRYGIIVKTGSALERLAEAKTIAFDKTGTLTRGILKVDHVTTFNGFSSDQVLSLAYSLEQSSGHVVAQAIVAEARAKHIKTVKTKQVKEIAGRGLTAILKGRPIVVGRLSLLVEQEVKLPAKFKLADFNQTAVFVATNGEMAGAISFSDELRPEAAETLQALYDLGIQETIMVTGDNKATAQAVARQLGISHVHAEALPADKLKILSETKERPLAFVGDGINDAPILTAADVGIALGARGVAAASESADLVILPDDVGHVATALAIAKRTFRIARQSILYGIALSIILMAIFASGKFPPLLGALLQEIVDVVVIFNALRAHMIKV